MLLPGDTQPSYELILPMNPQNKQNMISLIAARSSPVVGGQQLVDLHFPPGALVDGVGQVHARINANKDISTAKTLLGQLGSTVNFGNLLVVPLANSLLYVEPMFVQAQSNAVPLLEYVITATSTKVAFSTTLADSLNLLVGGTSTTPTGTVSTTPGTPGTTTTTPGASGSAQSLAQQALQHLQAYEQAEGKGDFMAGWCGPGVTGAPSPHDPYVVLTPLDEVLAETARLMEGRSELARWRKRIFDEIDDVLRL